MKGNARRSGWLGALVALLWTGMAAGQADPPPPASANTDVSAPADVDDGRWQRIVRQLQANGLGMEAALACLAPVQAAARHGLPVEPVLTRVEEGAAKGVAANALQEAGQQRLANLQRAADVLQQTGYGIRNRRHDQLMKSVALALESGLSADTLQGVLARAGSRQSERLRSIVEAGETMRLGGMDEPTVGQMMTDFTERNLSRAEVIRASRFAVQRHGAQMEGTHIRQQLWDGTGAGGQWGPGVNKPGAKGPAPATGGAGPADRGRGPAGQGAPAGSGGSPTPPGNAPTAPGDAGNGAGGGGDSGSGGSGRHEGNAPTDSGPRNTTSNRGR